MNIKPILSELGIRHNNKMHKQWLMCHCISGLHVDKNPDMGVNLSTGIVNCFACGFSTNIYKIVQDRKKISYKEAVEYVDGKSPISEYISKDPINNLKTESLISTKEENNQQTYSAITYKLDKPEDFLYTKIRGYTKEYCQEFNIREALSGLYDNYFLTPIIDKEFSVNTFEARKLKAYEVLLKYFNGDEEYFKKTIAQKKQKGVKLESHEVYLLQGKVLYPANSMVNNTIFNRHNLSFENDLVICEGIASHPKIYQYITKNVTSVFGANISIQQIAILKKFKKKKIVLSDNDTASYLMIEYLNKYFEDLYIYDCYADDKDEDFIQKLKNVNIIKAEKFLVKRRYL